MAVDGFEWAMTPSEAFKYDYKGWCEFCGNGKLERKSPEEWVAVAEALAAKHCGVLPCGEWLVTNRYSGLCRAKRRHPDLFEHIKQDNPLSHHRSPAEWVPIAVELAKEHGGMLPHMKWLEDNEYKGLSQVLRKYPELFEHISQARKIKKPWEYVAIAEALAKEHGGVLPCVTWLQTNRYNGLSGMMGRHRDMFEHIPQEVRNTGINSRVIGIRVNGKIHPIQGDAV